MDKSEVLLSGLGHGDDELTKKNEQSNLKRDQDSVDDFEHLDEEGAKHDVFDSPLHHPGARAATQNFLDTEREELFVQPSRVSAPETATDLLMDHIADKFTDSESDAGTPGESPIHRPTVIAEPLLPTVVETPKPSAPEINAPAVDPTPVFAPAAAVPEPKAAPEPVAPPPKAEQPRKEQPPAPAKPPSPKVETTPTPASRPTAHIIEAEVIFCRMGLDAWFDPQRLHPKVESLIYWRDPARSGIALGVGLALLVALACCSVVSVFAYVSLLGLTAAIGFRIYKNVLQAVQKTNEGHPFKWMLEKDISVPAERAQSLAAATTAHLNATTNELRRLFLVEDLVDSLKFGVLLWCLTYVGAYFNGITLIILGYIALFSLPKAYEMNKGQVDANLELVRGKINEISAKVKAAVPMGRKVESEKDK